MTEAVNDAALSLRPRRKTAGSAPVRVLRITERAERGPVYNLTVADAHEYYAAGVLVHNCDAARYVIASTSTIWRQYIRQPLAVD